MKISVITISYNSESTILKTLESTKNQKYKKIDHIIIDGMSIDNTVALCKKFDHISIIQSEPDKGIYDAFNKGIKQSKGEIIGFLNSDDIFQNNNSLQIISDAFDKDTDAVYGNLDYVDLSGKVVRKWRSKPFQAGAFSKGWMPAHPTFYCRKKVYDKLGTYDESYKIAGDFELMLRFFEKNNIRAKFINKTLIKMNSGGISNSGIKSKVKILKEEFNAFEQNDIKINKWNYLSQKIKKIKEFL